MVSVRIAVPVLKKPVADLLNVIKALRAAIAQENVLAKDIGTIKTKRLVSA